MRLIFLVAKLITCQYNRHVTMTTPTC
jgi:hypothetical protein